MLYLSNSLTNLVVFSVSLSVRLHYTEHICTAVRCGLVATPCMKVMVTDYISVVG